MASDEEEELEKMIEAMKIEMVKHSLTAVDDFDNIVKYSTDQNLNPKWTEHAAELLADWIKSCSIFQQTRLTEKAHKICNISKILLSRQFSYQFSSGFSTESLLSKHDDPKITAKTKFVRLFNKKPLPYPMAYGINTNGKLGIGMNTNKTEEGFQPVQLEGDIEKVYIGENHTIILLRNGEYYGVGETKNFLHEPKDDKPFSSVPIVLDYINAKRNKVGSDYTSREQCELTAETTLFRHFQKYNHHLVVGQAEFSDNNWEIISERPTRRLHVHFQNFIEKIALPDFNDPSGTMEVSISKNLVYNYKPNEYRKVHMFICGKKIVSLEDAEAKYGDDGLVWLNYKETLYKGQLQWAPKVRSDTDTSEYGLVAIMEEVVLEYSVENFAISKDGKSIIIYNEHKDENDEEKVSCLNNAVSNFREYEPDVDHNFDSDYAEFKEKVKNEWKHELYAYTGLPSVLGEAALPPIQTLRRFIAMNEEKKIPIKLHETFLTLGGLYRANEVSKALDGHLCELICESAAIKPIVVEAGWSEEERDERNKQISLKVSQYFEEFIVEVDKVLDVLQNLPLHYQQTTIAEDFKNIIAASIWRSMNDLYLEKKEDVEEFGNVEIDDVLDSCNEMKTVGDIVKERIQKGDIDGNDERFRLIRVEAVDVRYRMDGSDWYGTEYTAHTPYVCFTTLSHIKIIDMELLDYIENGVLNLNQYSIQKYEPRIPYEKNDETFRKMVNAFFFHSKENATKFKFLTEIGKFFRPEECYTVECNDEKVLRAPRIFFEIYSDGFDAARRRNAEREGKDPMRFKMNLPKRLVKKLIYALIDPRTIKDLSIEDLLKVLEVSQYWLFTEVQPKLVTLIVGKSEREQYSIIQQLFETHPKETRDAIAAEKPEILVYWRDFPMSGNYLKDLNLLITKIQTGQLVNRLPVLSKKDKSKEKITEDWLVKIFLNEDSDNALVKEFKKVITKWQELTPTTPVRICRKRRTV